VAQGDWVGGKNSCGFIGGCTVNNRDHKEEKMGGKRKKERLMDRDSWIIDQRRGERRKYHVVED